MKIKNVTKVPALMVLLALYLNMLTPVHGAPILIDLGTPPSYRSVETPSPDGNGN